MTLSKLNLLPDNSSYSVTDGKEVVSVQLDGGAGRYRRDILGASSAVSVQWVCDRTEYRYLRTFYSALVGKGAIPFLIDLILDDPLPVEHKAYFVPGSMVLTGQMGMSYYVSANLEVEPVGVSDEDITFAVLYGEFGRDYQTKFLAFGDIFDNLMNVQIPGDLVL